MFGWYDLASLETGGTCWNRWHRWRSLLCRWSPSTIGFHWCGCFQDFLFIELGTDCYTQVINKVQDRFCLETIEEHPHHSFQNGTKRKSHQRPGMVGPTVWEELFESDAFPRRAVCFTHTGLRTNPKVTLLARWAKSTKNTGSLKDEVGFWPFQSVAVPLPIDRPVSPTLSWLNRNPISRSLGLLCLAGY